MKSDDSIIFLKQDHVAKFSAQLSNNNKPFIKENNLDNLAKLKNLAKIKNLAKMTVKKSNQYYVAAVERSAKFPIDELQRRVLKKLRPRYSVDAYKDLLANLDHISGFERLEWLNMMDHKLRNERK